MVILNVIDRSTYSLTDKITQRIGEIMNYILCPYPHYVTCIFCELVHSVMNETCMFVLYSVYDLVNIHLFHDASNIIAMQRVSTHS